MDADIAKDVEPLNQTLFSLAMDPARGECVLRLLGASPAVIERIQRATPMGLGPAAKCGVPLVIFANSMQERLLQKPSDWPSRAVDAEDVGIRELTRLMLPIAYRAVRLYPELGQTYFGLTRFGAARLVQLAQRDLAALGESGEILVELRAAEDATVWDRLLMIGERVHGPRAHWVAENWAFLSTGRTQ